MSKQKRAGAVREVSRHEDAIAWTRWLESDEGRRCTWANASGQFLENRLWRAFMAGCEAVAGRSVPRKRKRSAK